MMSAAKKILKGERIFLRPIVMADAGKDYHRWLNDPKVTQFLEIRHAKRSLQNVRDYVAAVLKNPDDRFFAICLKESGRHIGNIKLGPINRIHHFAYIGLLIGEKDCWGKGFATEAIGLITQYAFDTLALHKVLAGCYANNVGSLRAFERSGFKREGLQKSQWRCGRGFVDGILLGLGNPRGERG